MVLGEFEQRAIFSLNKKLFTVKQGAILLVVVFQSVLPHNNGQKQVDDLFVSDVVQFVKRFLCTCDSQ